MRVAESQEESSNTSVDRFAMYGVAARILARLITGAPLSPVPGPSKIADQPPKGFWLGNCT